LRLTTDPRAIEALNGPIGQTLVGLEEIRRGILTHRIIDLGAEPYDPVIGVPENSSASAP
jgi:hypothetical protein